MLNDRDKVLEVLGNDVRTIRVKSGLSQEELATKSGLNRSYIGGIERGQRNVSVLNLQRIAWALNTPLHEILKDL